MTDTRFKTIGGGSLVAAASGLAAALLFVLAARGSLATVALGYFAPMPIMIASFSFGLVIGAGAALVGAAFVAIAFHPVLGLLFLVAVGAPAALIVTAAVLAPPAGEKHRRDLASTFAVTIAALISVLTIAGAVVLASWRFGGFAPLMAQAIKEVAPLVTEMLGETHASAPASVEELTRFLVLAAPIALAMSELLMMVVNLWLAGRVAVISGNLPRPWPAIADDLSVPPVFGALFAAACGLIFLGGLPGVVSSVIAAAFGTAFALQGLAVLHVLTRGASLRFALLFALYALILLLPPWPFCLLAIVGLVDAAFHLRTRKSASSAKTSDQRR